MPIITGAFDWEEGLKWSLGFFLGEFSEDSLHLTRGLVDTGASGTCISRSVAEAIGADPIEKGEMATASGLEQVNLYRVNMGFYSISDVEEVAPGRQVITRELTAMPDHMFDIMVSEFVPPEDDEIECLIGRDILCQGILHMSHGGHFSFSY